MIGPHDGESIVMRADGPEDAIAFDGFGGLLCLPVETDVGEWAPDVELIEAGKMPEGRFVLRSHALTEIACTGDWSRIQYPPRALLPSMERTRLAELVETASGKSGIFSEIKRPAV